MQPAPRQVRNSLTLARHRRAMTGPVIRVHAYVSSSVSISVTCYSAILHISHAVSLGRDRNENTQLSRQPGTCIEPFLPPNSVLNSLREDLSASDRDTRLVPYLCKVPYRNV
jgi:hypothetical protein